MITETSWTPDGPEVHDLTVQLAAVLARVADGAAWLDLHCPDWTRLVDVDELRMHEEDRCVLGQVYGDFYAAPMTLAEAIEYGFESVEAVAGDELDDPDDIARLVRMDVEYWLLEDAWHDLIHARRGATAGASLAADTVLAGAR